MKKQTLVIVNAIAFSATIAINYISNTGIINGNTMKSVSDRYQNLFTPASYAFAIWGIIYLLLAAFIIYSFIVVKRESENQFISRIGFWFIASCLANSLWVFAWLNDQIALSVILMAALLFTLIKIAANANIGGENVPPRKVMLVWWPFSLYLGWISVAMIANSAAFLTRSQWNGLGIPEPTWAIIMISVACALNVVASLKKNLNAFAVAGAWGLTAVALSNKEENYPVFIAGLTAAVLIVVCIITNLVKYSQRSPQKIENRKRV